MTTETTRTIVRTVAALSMGASARYELVKLNVKGRPLEWQLVGYGATGVRYILAASRTKVLKSTAAFVFDTTPHGLREGLYAAFTLRACDLE